MIHIVFNEVEVQLMQQVMELDPELAGEVVQIKDDYAVGPLAALDTEEGFQARKSWWQTIGQGSPYGNLGEGIDDRDTVAALRAKLEEQPEEQVWIWMGQNQHDVSGYYWLMPQLRDFQGRVMVLYMNNLPFINEKGQIFYPAWLHQIPAKEFIKAKKLARPITTSEFEVDPDEWKRLADENAGVRLLEGGKKLVGRDASVYDAEVLKNITGEWQKGSRVLTNILNRMTVKTGDVYVMWRMKELVNAGKAEVNGDINKNWKEFDIRLAGAKAEAGEVAAQAAE